MATGEAAGGAGAGPRQAAAAGLVGRDDVLALLRRAVEDAGGGRGRLVLLTAGHAPEPGDRDGELLCDADLAVLAGLRPVAVLCELVNDDGTMKRRPHLEAFAAEHRLALITIADLMTHLRATSGRWAEPASFSAG